MHLDRIRERMVDEEIDCLILTDSNNIYYAIGEEIGGYVFITQEDVDVVSSNFYRYEIEDYDPEFIVSSEGYEDALNARKDRYSGEIVTDAKCNEGLQEKFGAERTSFMQEVRSVKTQEEIDRIRKACEITTEVFENLRPKLLEMNEREAVAEIEKNFRRKDVYDAFLSNQGTALVQRNCLKPHRSSENQTIDEDDMVIVDMGARYKNYCADVTRTYCENPSQEQRELFETVKTVQKELIEMIKPGLKIDELRCRELELVEEKGFDPEKNVLHLTGHSVGIEVHEKPSISESNDAELKENMVLAIEPALYVSGVGGCRIEDTVLVTSDGAERLSKPAIEL